MPPTDISLLFEQDPWECRISRTGEIVFEIRCDYSVTDSRVHKHHYEFSFSDKNLRIKVEGSKISFQWQGEDINNQIPMAGFWYGGGELINQPLTLNEAMFPLSEFITQDNGNTGLSTVLSPIWLTSLGAGLKVNTPFFIGINQPPEKYIKRQKGLLPEMIPFNQKPFLDQNTEGDQTITLLGNNLGFEILIKDDILQCHKALVKEIGIPKKTPPLELMGAPIWTTWARYKDKIDQETVLEFAQEILDNDYPYHVLEIDDRWQTEYGDLKFDPERFPDPKSMISELKDKGFKVTVWVIPFFNPKSRSGQEAARSDYVVKTSSGDPYLVTWWQGRGYLLDVTNPDALAWFKGRLDSFRDEVGLDGYKFDAGEAKYAPADGLYHRELSTVNHYTQLYINWVAENFNFSEVRSGWMNQTAPIFFRLWDLWSVWGFDNGLRSIIPSTINMSLTGYPFVFPDMIGGNAYFTFPRNRVLNWIIQRIVAPLLEKKMRNNSDNPEDEVLGLDDVPGFIEKSIYFGYPTAELMTRWAQANVFLSVMQFSLSPWEFGEECRDLCRKAAELHLEYVPILQKFARKSAETGDPIIRPVFWLDPHDERALVCNDQFLVGDEILVAPVLEDNKRSRDIYIPPGQWKDPQTGNYITGPTVIHQYPAPMEVLPFFLRIKD